jgi:hypothetical protein
MTWTARWAPDASRQRWQLTITDEHGHTALGPERGAAFAAPRPLDNYLEALGLERRGPWAAEEGSAWAAPVRADAGLELRLRAALPCRPDDAAGAPTGKARRWRAPWRRWLARGHRPPRPPQAPPPRTGGGGACGRRG